MKFNKGLLVAAFLVIGISFITCANPYLGVVLIVIGNGFLGTAQGGGYSVNMIEVGGIYSGILSGVSNTFASLGGVILPNIVGEVTKNVILSF